MTCCKARNLSTILNDGKMLNVEDRGILVGRDRRNAKLVAGDGGVLSQKESGVRWQGGEGL